MVEVPKVEWRIERYPVVPELKGTLKLARLSFYAGSKLGSSPLTLDVPTVTVLVGPNNSGKSLALREIEIWCRNEEQERHIFSDIEATFPSREEEAISLIEIFKTKPPENHVTAPDHMWIGVPTFRSRPQVIHEQVSLEGVRNAVLQKEEHQLRHILLRLYTVRLDGRTRFSLSDPKPSGDLQLHPQNHLWALFVNEHAREMVRRFTYEAFGLHFVIDPTGMQHFRVRLSTREPASKAEEQALDECARTFHAQAALVSELSDGVQSFTGLVSAVLSFPHRIILVDEPEAFLHPPLARRLGNNLAQIATKRGASLLVATHSSEFLIGCLGATQDLRIIRLTFENSSATARSIEPSSLQNLMLDPLLRSAQALRGLFHRGVVVTESDTDRAFYEEVNHRLQSIGYGVSDCLFLNAQNWQTVPRIVRPLRELGIPAAAILDLDTLAQEQSWKLIFDMLYADQSARHRLQTEREWFRQTLEMKYSTENSLKAAVKKSGLDALHANDKPRAEALVNELAGMGLFLVRVGELESWLPTLRISSGNKKDWLPKIFEAMGSDPYSSDYLHPDKDADVWAFVEKIRLWIDDPARVGIPY